MNQFEEGQSHLDVIAVVIICIAIAICWIVFWCLNLFEIVIGVACLQFKNRIISFFRESQIEMTAQRTGTHTKTHTITETEREKKRRNNTVRSGRGSRAMRALYSGRESVVNA